MIKLPVMIMTNKRLNEVLKSRQLEQECNNLRSVKKKTFRKCFQRKAIKFLNIAGVG